MKRITIPKRIRDFLLVASKHQCSICQSNTVDVHHIIPVVDGGTNDLENLMAVCPNHHRDFHDGKFTREQMRTYRTQWLQQCRSFLEIGIPVEKLTKDRETASELPLEMKIQYIQESANCIVETIAQDEKTISLFVNSGASISSEITFQIITLVKLIYRLFSTAKIIRCTFVNNTREKILFGADMPELYSFIVAMNDVDRFIFGKKSINEFWNDVKFFKKKYIDVTNSEINEFGIPWVI